MEAFKSFNYTLQKVFKILMIAFLATMLCALFAQVVARYLFNYGIIWSEELGRYMCIWIALIGAAMACIDFSHIRVTVFEDVFKKAKPIFYIFQLLVCLAYGIFLLKIGVEYLGMKSAAALSPTLRIPMTVLYFAFPLAGAVIILNTFYLILEFFTEKKWKHPEKLEEKI